MLQKFLDLQQKITMNHIYFISCFLGIFSQIFDVIVKNPKYCISGIQIVI